MWPLIYSTVFICAVFIIEAASGQENIVNKFGAIGRKVSFGPASLTPPVSSITWKQSSNSSIVKAIEWDGDEPNVKQRFTILNPRFKDITTLDEKTGHITITNLNAAHAGTYIFEINSKEQAQKFKLEVMPPVPDPKIIIVPIKDVSDTVYLECRYNDTIIWKNSTGETLEGSKIQPKGKSITVKDTGKPENFYTCTLENTVSESTSFPVYERDLFKPSSGSKAGLIAGLVIFFIILLIIAFIAFYLRNKSFRSCVDRSCPCIRKVYTPAAQVNMDEEPSRTAGQGEEMNGSDQNNAERNPGPETTKMDLVYVNVDKDAHNTAGQVNIEELYNSLAQVNMDEDACNPAPQDQNNAERNPGPDATREPLYDQI